MSKHASSLQSPKTIAGTVSNADPPTSETKWKFLMEKIPESGKGKRVRFADNHADGPQKKRHRKNDNERRAERRARKRRMRYKLLLPPSVVDRLTGRTGNPEDPVYVPPTKKRYEKRSPWGVSRPPRPKKVRKDRKSVV